MIRVAFASIAVLLLAATPAKQKPLLEPKPGEGFQRLHPRRVTATSFLKNGWNAYEQNYLAIYAADDDPATAWVEGVDSYGIGESLLWEGPPLENVEAFEVFVRNGYQKTQALYTANARPSRLSITPLRVVTSTSGTPAAPAIDATLADVLGWQRIEVPVKGAVRALRFEIGDVNKGTRYDDTCISDVRVYVKGTDRWVAAAENRAADEIRAFVASRARAAKQQSKPHVSFDPSYAKTSEWSEHIGGRGGTTSSPDDQATLTGDDAIGHEREAALAAAIRRTSGTTRDWLKRAKARMDDTGNGCDLSSKVVRLATRASAPNAEVALEKLAIGESRMLARAAFFHRKDFGAFEESTERSARLAKAAAALRKLEQSQPACEAACKKILGDPVTAKLLVPRTPDALCDEHCDPEDVYESLDVPGDLAAESEVRVEAYGRLDSISCLHGVEYGWTGVRDMSRTRNDEVVWYDKDLVSAMYIHRDGGTLTEYVVDFLEWDKKSSPARLLSVTEVRVSWDIEMPGTNVHVATHRTTQTAVATP